ncbi:MAG: DUF4432 family protein [Mycetocola sp.]
MTNHDERGGEIEGQERRRFLEARVGAVERIWAPRAVRSEDGVAAGRRQIELRHLGGLDLTIEPDQFLDLGEAAWRGRTVSFVPPSTSIRAESWGRRWQGGLLTTCGLSAVGRAAPEDGGMHGRAHLIPASVTQREGRWTDDGEYELIVRGSLREGAVFEQNLTVDRTIRATHGVSEILITDVIRNEGFVPEPVKVLYHVNIGWPLLHGGAEVSVDAAEPGAGRDTGWERELDDPAPGVPERVDALVAVPDAEGWCRAKVTGASGSLTVRFRSDQLPYLTVWRSGASGSYALGIEPGTCWPSHAHGPDEGKVGRILAPGEFFTVDLALTFAD